MTNWRLIVFALIAALAGCERHMQDMYDQPRYKPLAESSLFDDGGASRVPVPGTEVYSQGDFAGTSSGLIGASAALQWDRDESAQRNPYPITMQLLEHGRHRFDIYCQPCHSPVGDGDGFIVRRGFPAPPSYHSDRLRKVSDRYLFDVISNGYGVMYPYGDRIPPQDRWAIVAYIRALQLSQHVDGSTLDKDELGKLATRAGASR